MQSLCVGAIIVNIIFYRDKFAKHASAKSGLHLIFLQNILQNAETVSYTDRTSAILISSGLTDLCILVILEKGV